MGASAQRGLPLLFPLYALLSLLRDVALALVLLAWHGLSSNDVLAELQRREGVSGIAEKASRK